MPSSLQLLGFDCPFVERARILLQFKGVEHTYTSMTDFGSAPDWFLKLNPLGKVPVLIDGEEAIYESNIINEYIEDRFEGPRAMPQTPLLRARTRLLANHCDKVFIFKLFALLMNRDGERAQTVMDEAVDSWRWLNTFLMKHSPEGDFAFGDFGLADMTYAPFFARYAANRHYRHFALPGDEDLSRVERWARACVEHPIVRQVTLDEDSLIKLYFTHSRGIGAGVRPAEGQFNSQDPSWPYAERPLPPRPPADYWTDNPDYPPTGSGKGLVQ